MRRIAAKYLYTLTSTEPVRNGFVEVEDDGTVVRTGVCADPAAEPEFIDGAVAPGFVNAHCHVELSYLKGQFRKGTGMAGFIDQINEMRDNKSLQEKVDDLTREMDSMWEQGVVGMADISNCDDSFAVKARHPMYTRTFLEVFGTEPEDCEAVMDGVRKLQKVADGFGIDAAPTPHSCYTMSPELVTAVSVEGLRSGFLSFHTGMSVPPVTGKSSLLYFIDRLLKGHSAPFDEHILLVHECCMDQEGIDAVKAVMNHPFVAVCPLSNLFIHNALPPIDLMRRNALKICVGTDSLSSNDDLRIVDELYCLQRNFPEVPLGELLTWASRNGAEFLAKPEFGTLEPGKRPGLVVIDHLDADGRLTAASKSHRL